MKKILSMAIAAALSFTGAFNATAADVEAGVVKVEQESQIKFLKNNPFKFSNGLIEKLNKAPAQGISTFEVASVISSNFPNWDDLYASDTTTNQNHGGVELYVAVIQVGYGNPNTATMNGISRNPISTENRCGYDFHPCNVGETVTGFIYYFDYSGQQSGLFQASANSVASPFGYWSDSVYIQ